MSGLVLKLASRERILINGAVIENGKTGSKIRILSPNANILRLKDAIHPDDAVSPVKRACYLVQLALIGESGDKLSHCEIMSSITDLSLVFRDHQISILINTAERSAREGDFYKALKTLRMILPVEAQLLELNKP